MSNDDDEQFDIWRMKRFIALSPEKKLSSLEEMNKFLNAITPEKTKEIQKKLREEGW